MPAIDPDQLLLVGVCGPPHGLLGEVKVIPQTDDPQRLVALGRVFVGEALAVAVERRVVTSRIQTPRRGPVVLMRMEGVEGREAAEQLRKQRVYALAEDLPERQAGEMYLHELHGLEVFIEAEGEFERIGVVVDTVAGVAQDLLVVGREGRSDLLVPDVPEIVTAVDPVAGRVVIDPPEGLID